MVNLLKQIQSRPQSTWESALSTKHQPVSNTSQSDRFGQNSRSWLLALAIAGLGHAPALAAPLVIAQTTDADATRNLCPAPALSRIQIHSVQASQTLEDIATAYDLLPVTILGMNPAVQPGSLAPGTTLRIPPFNGIEVTVPNGRTWKDLAGTYQIRDDILFEVNGCPASVPSRIFVPGVNWFQTAETPAADSSTTTDADPLTGYPLAEEAAIVSGFGWQTHPERDELFFSSGMTLSTRRDTSVLAAGDGTVAYVGQENGMRTLIVVNHTEGLQTRYAVVNTPQVTAGDRVTMGQALATTTDTAEGSGILYFEVRLNSSLGWVARDPGEYIPSLAVR